MVLGYFTIRRLYLELIVSALTSELYRESDREGQVDEGVRVALLKLVTDGSRPIGEISDN